MVQSFSIVARRGSSNDRTPPRATVTPVLIAGVCGVIIDLPIDPVALPACLTEAEREIVTFVLQGQSNQEIADARGVRYRTIANQLASVFRKLQVWSRTELVTKLSGNNADADQLCS